MVSLNTTTGFWDRLYHIQAKK